MDLTNQEANEIHIDDKEIWNTATVCTIGHPAFLPETQTLLFPSSVRPVPQKIEDLDAYYS